MPRVTLVKILNVDQILVYWSNAHKPIQYYLRNAFEVQRDNLAFDRYPVVADWLLHWYNAIILLDNSSRQVYKDITAALYVALGYDLETKPLFRLVVKLVCEMIKVMYQNHNKNGSPRKPKLPRLETHWLSEYTLTLAVQVTVPHCLESLTEKYIHTPRVCRKIAKFINAHNLSRSAVVIDPYTVEAEPLRPTDVNSSSGKDTYLLRMCFSHPAYTELRAHELQCSLKTWPGVWKITVNDHLVESVDLNLLDQKYVFYNTGSQKYCLYELFASDNYSIPECAEIQRISHEMTTAVGRHLTVKPELRSTAQQLIRLMVLEFFKQQCAPTQFNNFALKWLLTRTDHQVVVKLILKIIKFNITDLVKEMQLKSNYQAKLDLGELIFKYSTKTTSHTTGLLKLLEETIMYPDTKTLRYYYSTNKNQNILDLREETHKLAQLLLKIKETEITKLITHSQNMIKHTVSRPDKHTFFFKSISEVNDETIKQKISQILNVDPRHITVVLENL